MIWLLQFNLGRMSFSMPSVSCSMRASRVYATVAMTIISARMTAKLAQIRRRIVQFFMASITFGATINFGDAQVSHYHCTPGAEGRVYPMEQNGEPPCCARLH